MDSAATTIVTNKSLRDLFDTQGVQNCFECGICTASCSVSELISQYSPRQLLQNTISNPQETMKSKALWLCAWCLRCQERCPQGIQIPEVFRRLRLRATEKGITKPLDDALREIAKTVPLPLVAMLICFHPERAGLNTQEILNKVEDYRKRLAQSTRKFGTLRKTGMVAVIGSGPTGLTVAYELSRKGHHVNVFESLDEVGGMLRKGIPQYRLPKQILTKEIQFIKDMGVEFKTKVRIGQRKSFRSLFADKFEAVFVGTGTQKSQMLRLEGTEAKGVINALDFLWKANSEDEVDIGKSVVVVGGGNVALDVARTALHAGADEVTILYRRSREEMPANSWEVKEAEDDGVKISFLVSPKRIITSSGKVNAIECLRMKLGETDETGRKKAESIEGSEFTVNVDTVIPALGQTPDTKWLPKEIELNQDGTIWVDPATMRTTMKGVYAGGDVVSGPSSVIEAIRDGKRAAASIERHLKMSRSR